MKLMDCEVTSNKETFPLILTTESSSHVDKYEMLWWAKVCWTFAFNLILIIAISGNIIVIWIVTAHQEMRNVTNFFLVNLSVADVMLSVFNCLFNFIYMVRRDWQFGEYYCKINNFVAILTVAASVFTLTGISCERYLAIVHPLHPHLTKCKALISIILIWFFSSLVGIPCLLYSDIVAYRIKERIRVACVIIWPDGIPTSSKYDFMYQIIIISITYFIPMILMIYCYSIMAKVLWRSKSIGEMTRRQMKSIKSKKKIIANLFFNVQIVRMFTIIIIIFGICWLPYHSYFIYMHYNQEVLYSLYAQHIYLGFYWLAMSNTIVNPMIYYWMNNRFRKYFHIFLCGWLKCIKKSSFLQIHTGNSTLVYITKKSNSTKGKSEKQKETSHFYVVHKRYSQRTFIVTTNGSPLIKSNSEDFSSLKNKNILKQRYSM